MTKNYTIVKSYEDMQNLKAKLKQWDYLAYDVETTGLNVRKDKVIGFSVCGEIGTAFYVPLQTWNGEGFDQHTATINECQELLKTIQSKELLTWNGSFDVRVTKNNFGVDLTQSLIADGMLLKHTLNEEGPFGLKKVAIELQKELGLNVEEEANKEQIALKENVKKNGGSTTQSNYEMYKADLDVMGPYACFAKNSALVTMSNGSCKFIEDVVVGDSVITHTGSIKKVYELLKQDYSGTVYNLDLEAGRKVYNVTEYHPFLVLNQKTLKEEWVKTKDIKENDLLVRPYFKIKPKEIKYSDDFWWLYGMYQAEGYIRIQQGQKYPVFTVHTKEVEVLQNTIKTLGYTSSAVKKGTTLGVDVVVSSSELGEIFLQLSGGKFKCHEKQVSESTLSYLLNNQEHSICFMAGVFDGDGHYRQKRKAHQYCLSITSASLINTVDLLLSKYEINSTRGQYEPSKVNKGKIVGRRTRHAITLFGSECEYILMKSKYKTYVKVNDYSPSFKKYVRVRNIQKLSYNGEVHNIEVEDDHSYLVNGIISHNCNDADLTFRICEYYMPKLEEQGLSSFFFDEEVMPLYKNVTIPMEEAGVKLDLDLITQSNVEIQLDIAKLEKEIEKELLALPEVDDYLLDKAANCCETKPTGAFGQGFIEHFKLDYPKSEKTGKYLLKGLDNEALWYTLSFGEEINIKMQVFKDQQEGKLINIFSKKQMGDIAFNYLGYDALSETEKGNPQFNDEFIQSIAKEAKWAALLSDYNKLIKIKGSYIDRFLEGHEDGRFYFSYKQHGTISGRYGSDAQQLPRTLEDGSPMVLKYSNRIRKFFISGDNSIFLDCDYESLEPKTFAHVSNDEGLLDIFKSGKDFYSTIAIATEGLDEYSPKKDAPNYLGKLNKAKRQFAKFYSLGIPYGMTGYALGKTLDIPTEDAEALVNGYLDAFPKLREWMDDSKAQAQKYGFVSSELGRVRHLDKVKDIYSKYGDKLLDFKFRNKLGTRVPKEYVMSMYMDYKNGINNARNFQIQATAASIVNRAAIKINAKFKEQGIKGLVCAQIHDQLIMEVPEAQAVVASKIVQDIMENNIKLRVTLKAEPKSAKNWSDGH